MRSAPKSVSSLYYEAAEKLEVSGFLRASRSIDLTCFQMPINATVFPAIDISPFLIVKYPDPLNRTVQNILSGLSDVTDIEYLNTLPTNDPRSHLLATIQDPGSERCAELTENLQAIDAERGDAAKNMSTLSVYQKLTREGIDMEMLKTFERATEEETLRRQRPEFAEYENPDWYTA